jgi:hypothetical protein
MVAYMIGAAYSILAVAINISKKPVNRMVQMIVRVEHRPCIAFGLCLHRVVAWPGRSWRRGAALTVADRRKDTVVAEPWWWAAAGPSPARQRHEQER